MTQREETSKATPSSNTLSAEQVAEFLQTHPDFMHTHTEFFENVRFSHPEKGTISFAEHQLVAYRKKMTGLEEQIRNLVAIGQENEKIFEATCRLTEELLKIQVEKSRWIEYIERLVAAHFNLEVAAIQLWGKRIEDSSFVAETHRVKEVTDIFVKLIQERDHPICGAVPPEFLSVLKAQGKEIKSYALVPLIDHEGRLGVLILGSLDVNRFFPEMGTLFLMFIGRVLSHLLSLRLVFEQNAPKG